MLHLVCILVFGVIAFTLNWTSLDNPAPPSLLGQIISRVAGRLGFPLMTLSEFILPRLPSGSWMSAILRSPAIFVANSMIWGFGAALIWRRTGGKSHG
jgi:hypothetical protein